MKATEDCERSLAELKRLSTSPYPPEPPKRSLLVEAFVRLARLSGHTASETPHLYGGADRAKVQWEYEQAPSYLQSMEGFFDPNLLRDRDVLDVGCGWGGKMMYLAEHFAPRSVHGFDLPGAYDPRVPEEFAAEKRLGNCFFATGYAERVPFDDRRFDLVMSEDVLEHVADPEIALRECQRVLRSGGLLVAKFPSFRMILAHHLDRALPLPGLHYLLPMRTWAAGLNHLLLARPNEFRFEPFDEVVSTRFASSVTRNLNGLSFPQFVAIVRRSGFRTRRLELIPYRPRSRRRRLAKAIYSVASRLPGLREPLASNVLFVGEKP